MAKLLMCISQEEITVPFTFQKTGVNVFSIEEAMYHIFNNWRETDYLRESFLDWVKDVLNQRELADKIALLREEKSFSNRLAGFLTITEYFDPVQMANLKAQVQSWEKESAWEQLKEEADNFLGQENYYEAKSFYEQALAQSKNAALYNNLAICLTKLNKIDDAIENFKLAHKMEENNMHIHLNLAEAYILGKDFDLARRYLKSLEEKKKSAEIYHLYARINFAEKNVLQAIEYLELAIKHKEDNIYFYELANAYIKTRRYQDALDTLNRVSYKDVRYYMNEAEAHAMYNDYPAAIKCVQKASTFDTEQSNPDIWIKLAKYHRLNYDIDKARLAITKALSLDNTNQLAQLEEAKIKKASGKMRDYQKLMDNILFQVKAKYRKETTWRRN